MDNTQRRIRYLEPRTALPETAVRRAYREGTPDSALFTPAQRRRLKHKRGGAHVPAAGQLRRQQLSAARAARWDVLAPRAARPLPARPAPASHGTMSDTGQEFPYRAARRRVSRAARALALLRRRAG